MAPQSGATTADAPAETSQQRLDALLDERQEQMRQLDDLQPEREQAAAAAKAEFGTITTFDRQKRRDESWAASKRGIDERAQLLTARIAAIDEELKAVRGLVEEARLPTIHIEDDAGPGGLAELHGERDELRLELAALDADPELVGLERELSELDDQAATHEQRVRDEERRQELTEQLARHRSILDARRADLEDAVRDVDERVHIRAATWFDELSEQRRMELEEHRAVAQQHLALAAAIEEGLRLLREACARAGSG